MGQPLSSYDSDFVAWTAEQAAVLRHAAELRPNLPADWLNLAEEVESMGKSDKRAAESHLVGIIEHLLKLEFSPAVEPRRGWEESVDHHRRALARLLEDSPSLRAHVADRLAACWRDGRKDAARGLMRDGLGDGALPAACPYTLDQCLDVDWWPGARVG